MPIDNYSGGMHKQVEWMVPADSAIMRYMDAAVDATGNRAIQTPNTIALNTGYSNRHVSSRCMTLADHGLLERVDDSAQYRITKKGLTLMNGGIEPDEI